jgi:hypothetical protein
MDDMVELDEAMRRALSEHYGPTPGAKGRVLDGLRAQLGGPGGPDGSSGSSGSSGPAAPTGGGQAAWAAKVVAATLSLTGAGLLTIKLGAIAVASLAGPAAPTPDATTVSVARSSAPTPGLDASAAEPATVSAAANESAPAPAPTRIRERSTPTIDPTANSSDLAAELTLVRAAEQWRERDPHAALAKLEQHRSEFARGALAPEREVLRVELLCALERREQARTARDAFMASRSDPQLRARVEASCVGTGSGQSGN